MDELTNRRNVTFCRIAASEATGTKQILLKVRVFGNRKAGPKKPL